MLLPPGQIIHKDLNTSYTNFNELLMDLRENRFSGYVRINFWGYEGIFILDVGKVIQGFSSEKENFLLGEQAVLRMINKSMEKEGTIDVHSLSNEVSITLASVLGATIYKDETEVVGDGLSQLFSELENKNITGYFDVQFGSKKGLGTVYFLDGIPAEAVIMSNTGRIVAGQSVYERMIDISQLIKASVKVYWNSRIERIHEDRTFLFPHSSSPAFQFWNELLNLLIGEFNKVLKKQNASELWSASKKEIGDTYPFFDPGKGMLKWDGSRFSVHGVIPLADFGEGMITCLSLTLQKIPARRRKKLNVGKIIQVLNDKISSLPEEDVVYDPLRTIKKIFREIE